MNVVCLGLSHRTADVELRERFVFQESETGEITGLAGVAESVVLSTCNRVECYAAAEDADRALADLERIFRERAGIQTDDATFYRLRTSEAVKHLFRVVSGLESMVIGETEILGQVKKAYGAAADAGHTARHLNKLFQRAFNVAKEVRSQTNITRGAVSVGSVAVELAGRIFGRLSHCKVMILGAGEISELTARALASRGVKSLFVSNRTYDRAVRLAEELCGKAVRFDEWEKEVLGTDILISSTAAPGAILTRRRLSAVMHQRPDRPLFVIDLAVPRDVDPSVNDLDGVFLYDIDSLKTIAEQSLEFRRKEITTCERMIDRHVGEYSEWLRNADRMGRPLVPPSADGCQVARP